MRAIRMIDVSILAMTVAIAALLMWSGLSTPNVSAESRPMADADDFELTITADKDEYTTGEQPAIAVNLTNHTEEDVMLARPLDGSDFGRFPQLMWIITAPEGAPAPQPIGRCGNTNPITTAAFFLLPAGETVTLDTAWTPVYPHGLNRGPGVYSVQASYSTDDDDTRSWIGGPLGDDALRAKQHEIGSYLEQVPRVSLKSNTIELRIVADDPS